MPDGYKYRAFLSYSHQDSKSVDRLQRELERYRVPRRLGASLPGNLRPIFRDRHELSSGSSLSQVIQQALEDSEFLIVICSPASMDSTWVNEEIRVFQTLGRGDRILCFLVDGDELCFPEAILHPVDSSGKPLPNPEEPIAADARGGKAQWRHATMMLIAGLLRVGLDKLLQRDMQRRTRRLIGIAGGSVILAVLMAGLTVFAFLAQAEAERNRKEAEDLVGYLLGDLRDDLYTIGRSELSSSVAEKAMAYFEAQDKKGARDEILAQRAEALRQIGGTRQDLADTDGAMEAFEESLQIMQGLVGKNPDRVDWKISLAESHFFIGQVYWERGEIEAASEEFQKQLELVDAAIAADSDNPERLEQGGYAWTNYGRVLELGGQYPQALEAYETVMEIFQRLAKLQPGNADIRLEVGFAHNNLGKLKSTLGLLDQAETHYRNDLQIKTELSAEDPANILTREYFAVSYYWLGGLLLQRGKLEEAAEKLHTAIEILDVVQLDDPEAPRLFQRKAMVQLHLATICRLSDEDSCAAANINQSLGNLTAIIEADPDNARWLRARCGSQLEAAWQAETRGDSQLADSLAENALKTLAQLIGITPFDRELRKLQSLVLLTRGDLAQRAEQTELAAANWQHAQDLLDEYFASSKDPQIADIQLRLSTRGVDQTMTQQYATRLEEAAYLSPYPWP